jgi:hypothetical protein
MVDAMAIMSVAECRKLLKKSDDLTDTQIQDLINLLEEIIWMVFNEQE